MACWATDIDSMYLLSSGDSLGDIAHGWWLDYHKYSEYENDFNEVHRKMLSVLEELFGSNNENEDWEKLYQILRDFVWHIISKCNCKNDYDIVSEEILSWIEGHSEKSGEKYEFIVGHTTSLLRFVENRKTRR
jgi:hypothetical protein